MFLPLIFLICGVYAIWLMARQRKRMKVLDPPVLPGSLPLIGHGYILYGDGKHTWNVLKWISQESLAKGGVITMNIGPRVAYAITDPDDTYMVAKSCLIKDYYYNFSKPWLGNGLVSGSGPIWKRHRKLLNPAFNQHVLDGFMGVFNNQSRQLVGQLSAKVGKGPFSHLEYIFMNSLETVFREYNLRYRLSYDIETVFGLNDKYTDEIGRYLKSIGQVQKIFTERFQKFWLHSDFLYNMTQLKAMQDKHVQLLHTFSNMVLENRKLQMNNKVFDKLDYQNANEGKFKPFLDLLLELSDDEKLITYQEIREEVDTFMIAGYDTSSYVVMYSLMNIGSYPNVQEKVSRELQDVLGYSDRDVTKHDLHRLDYLEAVIKETLRLYPIAPIVARYADSDVKLKNYTIPAGCSIFLLLWGMHHHSIWGPDAAEFKPERWLSPSTLPANANSFAGFSIGQRNCIGKTFAMMSMKTTLAHLLRQYRISANVSKMTLKIDVMLKPDTGNVISLDLRRPKHQIGC